MPPLRTDPPPTVHKLSLRASGKSNDILRIIF